MNIKDLTIDQNNSIKSTLKKITKSGLGAIFLTNKNKLTNVVTDGDIRRYLFKGKSLSDKIKDVKTKNYVFVKKNHDFLDLQKKISKHKLVPIINNKHEIIDYANSKRFRQIPHSEPSFFGNELKYLTDTITSGWISSIGSYVDLFEKKFAKFIKAKYTLSTSSGTSALHLAISSLKLKKNDEIIVPDYTFVSPINSIIHNNCKPVLADIDKKNLCISYDSIRKLINKKTKALIIVHLYGNMPDMRKIVSLCRRNKIRIIEDCAESLGSKFKNKHAGLFGDVSTFSFFGNKTISTGEGGMIVFRSKKMFELSKKLRDHGMNRKIKYWHDEVGYNFRLTNMQAAVGCAQIENGNYFIKRKIAIQKRFQKNLKKIKKLIFPEKNRFVLNSHWLTYFIINSKNNFESYKLRNKLVNFLIEKGVDVRTGFFSAHKMDIYKKYKKRSVNYENSLFANDSVLTLPSSINIKNKEIDYISDLIKVFFKKN